MNRDLALSGLVHDLNNIFQTLVDAADLLSEDPQWKQVSAAILRSVERGRHATQSLQANRGPRVPFQVIVDSAISFVEDELLVTHGPSIEFKCQIEPDIDLPGSWAWERVLINLFLNAMRAMPQGGEIQVETRRLNSGIQIVIRDSGRGIAQEVMGRLFEAGVSTSNSGGLGLHVVRSIVEDYGGSVHAANRVDGTGAEFSIKLPEANRTKPAHA